MIGMLMPQMIATLNSERSDIKSLRTEWDGEAKGMFGESFKRFPEETDVAL